MSCINPLSIYQLSHGKKQTFTVPCGHCLNCMIKKQSQLTFLSTRELLEVYKSKRSASFVTLTYDDNHIPYNENGFVTLRKSDVQKFLKNLRRNMEYHNCKIPFKTIYCGEYGDGSHSTSKTGVSTCRPHYHIAFLGLSDTEVKVFTRKLWRFGLCDIGPLTSGGIRYICKYLTKACPDKDVKELREIAGVENPFLCHSIGLGKKWIEDNLQKIVDDGFTFNLNGKRYLFPKYVMQFVSNHTGVDFHRYVTDYLCKERLPLSKTKGIEYSQFDYDDSFIKYKYKVAALRSQNKPINDITLSKAWVKPNHSLDRNPLVDLIQFTPKEQRFDYERSKKRMPMKKVFDNKLLKMVQVPDLELFIYGDVVPF